MGPLVQEGQLTKEVTVTVETTFQRITIVGRFLSAALGILTLCFVAIVLIVWLVMTKQTQTATPVQEAPVTHMDEEARVQALVNQLQTLKVQHAHEIQAYKRLTANLQAQIAELTPRVNRVDDQI